MFEAPRQMRAAVAGAGNYPVAVPPYSKIDFKQLWSLIWRGKVTIVCCALAALALAMLFVALAPREYTATAQILIDPTDLRTVGNDTNANLMSDAALLQVESQVHVLTSDAVLRRVVNAEHLDRDPEFVRGPSILSMLTGGTSSDTDRTLAALNELGRHVRVKRADRTYVVEIDVTSRDPEKAARIANAIIKAYLEQQTEVRADAARQVSRTLSARLKQLKDDVREAEDKVEAFKVRNNLIGSNGQLVTEQQLTDMNNQLVAARGRVADAKARLEQVEQVQRSRDESGAFPEALQSPTIGTLRTQYAEVMRREAEQTATLGALHPAVIDIHAQAERLRHMIAAEVDRVAVGARTEYESAKLAEQTINKNLETLKNSTADANSAMVGLRELERDAQASRDIYQAFLVRARESGELAQLDTKNIRVISPADLPLKRSWPPPTSLLAIAALLAGLAAGAGIVLLRAPAVDEGDTPQTAPEEEPKGRVLGMVGRLWPVAKAPTVRVLAEVPELDVAFGLSALDDPRSSFGRDIRRVYDEVLASHTKAGNPAILIVASDDEDDSATVALALAAVAASKQRVLLIDADLDRRTLSALDAERSDAGLVDVAVGRRRLSEAITHDRGTNINLLPLVSPESRRDRRIGDADVKRAFDQTRRFDMVFVAAMDGFGNPGIRFFAGLVDHILIVARADAHDERAAENFVRRLGRDGRKVRGAVLTSLD
jgi:polysaccharide biosynthesis transport protein